MGNRGVPFKRLPEETSPPLKAGFSHSHSTSVEMESLQQVNGNNKWHKKYTQFGIPANRWNCRRFKPRFAVLASCYIVVVIVIAAVIGLITFKLSTTSHDSFASKQDILELHLLMNKSLDNVAQQLNDQKSCNNSHALYLQDQISAIQEQLRSMQSINVTLSSQIDTIWRNLSDLSEVSSTLQKQVDSLTRKDSLNQDSVDRNVIELTEKVSQLEGFAANLSSAQQELESGVNVFHTNLSSVVVHLQNDISNISDIQDHISVDITLLQHNISQLGTQLNTIHSSMKQASSIAQGNSPLSSKLSQLERQLIAIANQIHNPVNLYKNCQEETKSCTIDPDHSHKDYWRDCPTEYLPLHKQGWFTLSYQCKYKSASRMNMEALTPFEWDGKIRCDCDVTFPGDDTERHRPVPRDIRATCTLVVVRCPSPQTVYQ